MRRRKARRVVSVDSAMNATPPTRSLVFLCRPKVVGAEGSVVVVCWVGESRVEWSSVWKAISGDDGDAAEEGVEEEEDEGD